VTRSDPLDFFDKVAEVPPIVVKIKDKVKQRAIGTRGDRYSSDTGEAALAGLSISSMGVAQRGAKVGQRLLRKASPTGGPWPAHSPGEFSTIKRTLRELRGTIRPGQKGIFMPPPKKKNFLGLLPIAERAEVRGGEAAFHKSLREMKKMQPLVDGFIKKHDLTAKGVKVQFKGGMGGSAYDILHKKVRLARVGPAEALHELGHAADYTKGPIGKIRGVTNYTLNRATMLALPIAYIAGDEIKRALPGTVDDRAIEFLQQNAPAVLGATMAATSLYPEAKASMLAIKHVRDTKGKAAAMKLARTLIPRWSTYALATIPAMIGISLAKKYYNESRSREDAPIEKAAASPVTRYLAGYTAKYKNLWTDVKHVSRQIGHGSKKLINDPQRAKRIAKAAKAVGTDPSFIYGALSVGIPTTLTAAYVYGTDHGAIVKERLDKVDHKTRNRLLTTGPYPNPVLNRVKKHVDEDWKSKNPGLYSGLVGSGAALSAGIMTKLFHDLMHAM